MRRRSSGSGSVQGAVVFVLAWLMRAPLAGEAPASIASKVIQTTESFTPQQMLATPVFWVLYVMFLLVAASGLMATAQIALIARDFDVANVAVLGVATTLTVALLVDNVANGAGAADLRLDVGPYRPREHDGDRLLRWAASPIGCSARWAHAVGVYRLRRADFPDLGRDFQPLPVDLHRQLRAAIRDRQSQLPLHREGRRRRFSCRWPI